MSGEEGQPDQVGVAQGLRTARPGWRVTRSRGFNPGGGQSLGLVDHVDVGVDLLHRDGGLLEQLKGS